MLFIPIAFGAAIVSGLTWAFLQSKKVGAAAASTNTIQQVGTSSAVKKGISGVIGGTAGMVQVQLGNDTWLVAKDYIGPIGIGEAADLAKTQGMELPSAALVDAIWRQADLKLLPMPRNNIVSQAVFDDQKEKIAQQIGGRSFTLLGGTFKDIIMQSDKFPGLYGWHVEDSEAPAFSKKYGIPLLKPISAGPGKIIQPQSGHAHGLFFKDYSQGVRLVKKM